MTSREDTPTQIYIPALCRELVPCTLPKTVRFFDPGLPQTVAASGFFHPQTYPLSPEQAVRTLEELLAVGEALDLATAVGSQAAQGILLPVQDNEKTDIAHFAAGIPQGPVAKPDQKIAAQKVLLLTWDLERRLLEIADLRQKVAEAVNPLQENLHGKLDANTAREFSLAFSDGLPGDLTDIPNFPEPDWRLCLAAMAAFLPENALLITCHPEIRDALRETGDLLPLSECAMQNIDGWQDTMRSKLFRAKVPLWKILGHALEPKNAPWLLVAPEIIVCPAQIDKTTLMHDGTD